MVLLAPDDRARWDSVLSGFRCHIFTLQRAQEVKDAQQRVLDTAMQLMREVITDRNSSTITCRLPPEVLAACFSFLSMKQLFAATHVCRSWRSTALGSAALWSTLNFDDSRFAKGPVLTAAAARAGRIPLAITLPSIRGAHEEVLGFALARHMHQVRHLNCALTMFPAFLLRPAPMLESLNLQGVDVLPVDFLGGQPGRLATLNITSLRFPAACAALSTLTTLSASIACRSGDHASLARLFTVCPRLENLTLSGLVDQHFEHLSAGTPTHLRTLNLRTYEPDMFDLVRYFRLWAPASPRLLRIGLNMEFDFIDAAPIFTDVEELSITQHSDRAIITTTNTPGRQCTLVLRHPRDCLYDSLSKVLAVVIADNSARLGQLRSLSAPVTVLHSLFTPPPDMPLLRALNVIVDKSEPEMFLSEKMFSPKGHWVVFPCEKLACLHETEAMPLTQIEIVAGRLGKLRLESRDVHDLLVQLAESLPLRLQTEIVQVILHGLPDELMAGVALPAVSGYNIRLSRNQRG